jgi:hypothetical protein
MPDATCVPLYVRAAAMVAQLTLRERAASVGGRDASEGNLEMKNLDWITGAIVLWTAVVMTVPAPAQARAYGSAGCGLGSLIFEPGTGFTQVFAATTNGSFGTQTFGITSGTSNCDGSSGGSASAKAFVETNRVALAKDIARGSGETIDSLTQLAGCQSSPRAVGSSLQRRFDQIFADVAASDGEVGDSVIAALRADAILACSALDAG